MKHLIFLLALLLCLAHGSAQYYEEKILLSAGVNMISNPNADNIRPAIGEVDFKSPFFAALEFKPHRLFGLEGVLLSNKIKVDEPVGGGGYRSYDYRYFAADLNAKLYFEDLLTRRYQNDWDLFLVGGGGIYRMAGDNHPTINIGGGGQFWLSKHFGLGLKALGKIGLGTGFEQLNNYYQVNLGLMYRI